MLPSRLIRVGHFAFAISLLAGAASANGSSPHSPGSPPFPSWGYLINGLGVEARALLDASEDALLVIDYSADGSAAGELSPADVAALRDGPCGRRLVLSYLSIGEAESYRFYWDPRWTDQGSSDPDRPAWLAPENPSWPGNYKVRYWMPEWQGMIVPPEGGNSGASYVEKIVAAGFDGVYLDIVDAFEFFGPDGTAENPDAAADMVAFVGRIAGFGRSVRPGFLVFPQNGSALAAIDSGWVPLVDGIGAEDTFWNDDEAQDPAATAEVTANLDRFVAAGKPVLAVDYCLQKPHVDDFYAKAIAKGYVPYAATRELDRLVVHSGHEPVCGSVVTRADGATLVHAPLAPASAQNPAYSPDGGSLLFTTFSNGYNIGPAGLYRISIAGGPATTLLFEPDADSVNLPGTSWCAPIDRIVFTSDRRDRHEIWTMRSDGTDLWQVTSHTGADAWIEPSWNETGDWIVFEAQTTPAGATEPIGSIWKTRSDGTSLIQLTGGSGVDDRQPNWSPRGDRIVFQRRTDGSDDWNLFTIAPDGSDLRQVTSDPGSETDVSWSPDGSFLVYAAGTETEASAITVVPAAGGTAVAVTNDLAWRDSAPSWSPDGGTIAFESKSGMSEASPTSLFRIAAPRIACAANSTTLCLNGSRFKVQTNWRVPSQATSGVGTAVPLTGDTGYFWFFNSSNIELVIKVLDGRGINGRFWVFYGALSNVEYTITVTDTQTGAVKTYFNPSGNLASVSDTQAFSLLPLNLSKGSPGETQASAAAAPPVFGTAAAESELTMLIAAAAMRDLAQIAGFGPHSDSRLETVEVSALCTPGATTLCLNSSRFMLQVNWRVPSQGTTGVGTAMPLTGDTGYFWFFGSNNVELVIKVLDGRSLNNKFWVFYGALSDVEYTITVTDTQTGAVKTYFNPSGTQASIADTAAFDP